MEITITQRESSHALNRLNGRVSEVLRRLDLHDENLSAIDDTLTEFGDRLAAHDLTIHRLGERVG